MTSKNFTLSLTNGEIKVSTDIPHFTLLGLLEAYLFDMKTQGMELPKEPTVIDRMSELQKQEATTIRERIGKAQAAIRALGGEVAPFDIGKASDAERLAELDELTNQYKRLKAAKEGK